ncbi:DUF4129 domain-containing protein [Luteipulveratus mongoliensis]|uniref:DUF4129 domain-containing protein n=1 Tax=Luteipulveratus mongoliensis TaxID=571913 RepID=UPI000697E5E1|nr:DUF4129 domain-containing protein [Luteipulveratus mongoliensis]
MSGGQDRRADLAQLTSSRAGVVTAVTALGVVVLMYAVTSGAPFAHSPQRDWDQPTRTVANSSSSVPTFPTQTGGSGAAARTTSALFGIVGALIICAILALVGYLLFAVARALRDGWRGRTKRRRSALVPLPPAIADAVTADAAAQRAVLAEGPPANAIIACWVRLEGAVAEAGVVRRPSETSAELTIRVLDELEVDHRALRNLAELYREARFSRHTVTENHRTEARHDLDRLHRSIETGIQS